MATLMQAYTIMLGDVTTADCSARQINGILLWQDATLAAVNAAMACDPPGQAGMSVAVTSSSTHRGWRTSAGFIVAALLAQIGEAEYRIVQTRAKIAQLERTAEMHEAAARQAAGAAAAAEAQASAALANAAAAHAAAMAAGSKENGQAAASASSAQASAFQAEAAAATAAAEAARGAQAYHQRQAAICREQAEVEKGRKVLLQAWLAAATDAHQIGQRLITQENVIALPIGEAIAAAGGLHEVAGNKRYFQR